MILWISERCNWNLLGDQCCLCFLRRVFFWHFTLQISVAQQYLSASPSKLFRNTLRLLATGIWWISTCTCAVLSSIFLLPWLVQSRTTASTPPQLLRASSENIKRSRREWNTYLLRPSKFENSVGVILRTLSRSVRIKYARLLAKIFPLGNLWRGSFFLSQILRVCWLWSSWRFSLVISAHVSVSPSIRARPRGLKIPRSVRDNFEISKSPRVKLNSSLFPNESLPDRASEEESHILGSRWKCLFIYFFTFPRTSTSQLFSPIID